jgi:hypothetical protein
LQGSNFASNGFSLFEGGIIPTATRTSDRGRKTERERATATRESNATPRTAQFFGASRRFLGSAVFSAGWNGSKRLQAIFYGFTAHGLKAPNGSRTRQGFPTSPTESTPQAEQGRSDNPERHEGQPFCQPLGQPKSPDAPMCEETVALNCCEVAKLMWLNSAVGFLQTL